MPETENTGVVPEDREQLYGAPQERGHFPVRRLLGAGALLLSCGGVAGAAFAALTPTDIELGPHRATAQITFDNTISFDLGPLGSATHATGFPVGGVKVTVKGIPVLPEQSALTTASTVTAQYEQLLADPQHIKKAAEKTVETRIWHDAAAGGALAGAAGMAVLGLREPGRRRKRVAQAAREEGIARAAEALDGLQGDKTAKAAVADVLLPETVQHSKRQSRRLALVLASATLAVACSGDRAGTYTAPDPAVDHTLDGTPFEGYAVHGELLRLVVDEAAPRVRDFIDENAVFYEGVATHFNTAFRDKFGVASLGHPDLVYLLSLSDNHCNIGMDKVHGAIANAFKVDGVIDSGDMTMGGTEAERECVSAELDATAAGGREQLLAAGNHDSPTTERQAASRGAKVLHLDKIVKVAGLRIMGESDVNESTFGTPEHVRSGAMSPQEETQAITKAACKQRPDILVVHEPPMAAEAIAAGCARFSISGHLHQWYEPRLVNAAAGSYQFIEGTSGGAKAGNLTVGVLKDSAVDTIVAFDKSTHQPVGYYTVLANPDKSVEISDFTPLSAQLQEPLENGSGD